MHVEYEENVKQRQDKLHLGQSKLQKKNQKKHYSLNTVAVKEQKAQWLGAAAFLWSLPMGLLRYHRLTDGRSLKVRSQGGSTRWSS